MSVADILSQRTALSFEVSPPRTDVGMARLCGSGGVLEQLYQRNPDCIACTYGAGGADVGKNLKVLDTVLHSGRTVPMTYFSCIGNTREGIQAQLQTYLDHGIHHMLAQQGELPNGWKGTGGELQYAFQLVDLARQTFGSRFTIAVAGMPEGRHSIAEDVQLLRRKQDAGADYIVTRLCWDMDAFCRWLEAVRAADIRMPVVAGIAPVVDMADTISMTLSRKSGVMPRELSELISRHWIYPNPFVKDPFDADAERKRASFKSAGIDYTIRKIEQYRACGVSGIHLHTGNRAEDVAFIAEAAGLTNSAAC